MWRSLIPILIPLAGCAGDETIAGYADTEATYVLESVDGQAFAAHASVSFPAPGQASGQGPCNSFSAEIAAPYPWFALGPIRATRMACADLDAESDFFASLGSMELSELQGEVLILSTPDGRTMVFRREP